MKTLWTGAAAASCCIALSCAPASAQEVCLDPVQDNTLIESPAGNSNGLGEIYSGRVGLFGGATLRRGVMQWDVAGAIPAGSTITSVRLEMQVVLCNLCEEDEYTLHRVLSAWGEGTSIGMGIGGDATPGDCTWDNTFFPDQLWGTPGGDFVVAPSGATLVEFPGSYAWGSTAQMVADVQSWLDDPASNFGWMLIGNEVDQMSVKAFASRESFDETVRPKLTITFESGNGDPCPWDLNDDGDVGPPDLSNLLDNWGPSPDNPADFNGDGDVGPADLSKLLDNWGPCPD